MGAVAAAAEGTPAPRAKAWVALRVAAVYVILLVHVMDTSIANLSLLSIAIDLRVDAFEGPWIVMAFGLGQATVLPFVPALVGWLGQRAALSWVLLVSVVALGWCGMAEDFHQLVVSRGLQGMTSGAVVLLCQRQLLTELGEGRRAFGLALWSSALAVAPVLGPFAGATAISAFTWRVLFTAQVPLLVLAALPLRSEVSLRRSGTGPAPALGLIGLLGACLLLFQLGGDAALSLDSMETARAPAYLVAGGAVLAVLLWRMRVESNALFDWSLLRDRAYVLNTGTAAALNGLAMLSSLVYPLWLQTQLGFGVFDVARVLSAGGLIGGVLSPLIGRIQRKGAFPLLVQGGLAFFVASFALSTTLGQGSSRLELTLPRILIGFGLGLCSPLGYLAVARLEAQRVLDANALGLFLRALLSNVIVLLGAEAVRIQTAHYSEGAIAAGYGAPPLAGGLSTASLSSALASEASTHAMRLVFGFCATVGLLMLLTRLSAWTRVFHGSRRPSPATTALERP